METGIFISQNSQGIIKRSCDLHCVPSGSHSQIQSAASSRCLEMGIPGPQLIVPHPLRLCAQSIPLLVPVLSTQPRSQPEWDPLQHQPGPGEMPPAFLHGRRGHQRHQTSASAMPCLGPSPPLPVCIMENDVHGVQPRLLAQLHMPGAS